MPDQRLLIDADVFIQAKELYYRFDVTVHNPFKKLPLRSQSLSKGGEGWGEGSKQQGV
jgi:hypothetical protein